MAYPRTQQLTRFHAFISDTDLLSCSEHSAGRHDECFICLDPLEDGTHQIVHNCGNALHYTCLSTWLQQCMNDQHHAQCSYCRAQIVLCDHLLAHLNALDKIHWYNTVSENSLHKVLNSLHSDLLSPILVCRPQLRPGSEPYDEASLAIISDALGQLEYQIEKITSRSLNHCTRLVHLGVSHYYREFTDNMENPALHPGIPYQQRTLIEHDELHLEHENLWNIVIEPFDEHDIDMGDPLPEVEQMLVGYFWSCVGSRGSVFFRSDQPSSPQEEAVTFSNWVLVDVAQHLKDVKRKINNLIQNIDSTAYVRTPSNALDQRLTALRVILQAEYVAS